MIVETAQVVQVQGRYALVRTERRTACERCAVNKGCGTSVLSRVLGRRWSELKVLNTPGARVGDTVNIGVGEAGLLKSALVIYATPLAGIAASALTGTLLFGPSLSEPAAVALGAVGFVAGLLLARRFSARAADNPEYHPVVLSIEGSAEASGGGALAP